MGARVQAHGVRRVGRPWPCARTGLPVAPRRRSDAAAGRPSVGSRHGRSRRADPRRTWRREGQDCPVRRRRRERRALCEHHARHQPGGRPQRPRRGDGQQATEGARGARNAGAAGCGPGTRAAGVEMAGRKLPRAFGLGGFDGHPGQRGLPQRDRRPAHPQLPGSIFPGCRTYQRQNHAEDDPPRARHLPGLSDPLQAGGGIHAPGCGGEAERVARRRAGRADARGRTHRSRVRWTGV